jgi:AcrR family transcriptional regulator
MSEPLPQPQLAETFVVSRRDALRQRIAGEILAAAARLLATTGEQATMNDVAGAAGIARATLYRYFANREALVEGLRRVAIDDAAARLTASRVDQVDPAEGLERAIRAFVEVGMAFVVGARDRRGAHGAEFDSSVARPLRALVERGQSSGVIRDDMSALWLSESLIGLIAAATAAEALGTEDTVASIKRLFMDGARRP